MRQLNHSMTTVYAFDYTVSYYFSYGYFACYKSHEPQALSR